MAYIGNQIRQYSDRVVLDSLTASATANYTLQLNGSNYVPSSAESLTVSLNGVIQKPQNSYTVSGSTLSFASALTASDSIDFVIAERGITLQTPSAGSVNTEQLASNAVTSAKISYPLTTFSSTGIDDNATSTAITIDSSERVGIGISAPTKPLHIKKDNAGNSETLLLIQNNSSTVDTEVEIRLAPTNYPNDIGSTARWSAIRAINTAAGNATQLTFLTNAASADPLERMRIDSSGNVLIGITAPTAGSKFRVKGAGTTNASFCFSFENGTGVVFQAEDSGRFKTGTQSQSPYNYAVTGRDVYVSSAGLIGYLSSIRDSKTNIENISDVSWLYQLNPVSFNYKVQDEQGNYTEEAETDKFYGLIAEEVEPINSDICFYNNNNPEDGLAGVDYKKLYAPMIKALQEQQTKIQELEARITVLENK